MAQPEDTTEGQDLVDAWNYLLNQMVNVIPQHRQQLQTLFNTPIEG